MKTFGQIADDIPNATDIYVEKRDLLAMNIRRVLRTQGLTQSSLARKTGISESQISDILRGEVNVTLRTIARIEDALGVRIVNFLHDDDDTRGMHPESEGPMLRYTLEWVSASRTMHDAVVTNRGGEWPFPSRSSSTVSAFMSSREPQDGINDVCDYA